MNDSDNQKSDQGLLEDLSSRNSYFHLLGELSSGLFHEIRTPLQLIDNNLLFLGSVNKDSLKAGKAQNSSGILEEIQSAVEQSREGIFHVKELMDALHLLAYPKVEEASWLDPSDLWAQARLISRHEWKSHCSLNGPESCPYLIKGNSALLIQVLVNLIINAAHSIDSTGKEKGNIELTIERGESDLMLCISDEGEGIQKEQLDKIFTPFFTTKSAGKGTGQGLPFVRKVVEGLHKGKVSCESTLHRGSRFFLAFPAWKESSS